VVLVGVVDVGRALLQGPGPGEGIEIVEDAEQLAEIVAA